MFLLGFRKKKLIKSSPLSARETKTPQPHKTRSGTKTKHTLEKHYGENGAKTDRRQKRKTRPLRAGVKEKTKEKRKIK